VYDKGNKVSDIPLLELRVDDSVGEAFTTDTDALKHTVTLQLMQDQLSIHDTCQYDQLVTHW